MACVRRNLNHSFRLSPTARISSKPTSSIFLRSQSRAMSTGYGIENTNPETAPGVTLDERQRTIVGCVLDLFAGRPSPQKLALWEDDAVFEDQLTIAKGREQYEPQWYGLEKGFKEIERLHHEVTSAGNPISMDLKTRYVIAGIGKEQTIESKVNIFYNESSGKITKVQDKWGGKLPESSFADFFRKLNAKTVPKIVSVPDSAEK